MANETVEIPAILTINVGTDESPIPLRLNLAKVAKLGAAFLPSLVQGAIRNLLRDARGNVLDALAREHKKVGKSEPTEAEEDAAWKAGAAQRLKGWEDTGYVPGGGGVTLTPFVVAARKLLLAAWPKGKGAKVRGIDREAMAKLGESELRTFIGEAQSKAIDAHVAAAPKLTLNL